MLPNPLLELSLRTHPDFLRKLVVFCHDYDLTDKPALIWQCRPVAPLEVNIAEPAIHEAIRNGAAEVSNAAWWYAFHSSQAPVFTFDGVAASAEHDAGWMSEMHSDGHIIAGLWTFPQENSALQLSDWHSEAFTDFAVLAKNLYAVAQHAGAIHVTCTLLKAPRLTFVRKDDRSRRVPRQQLQRPDLQWRVRVCDNSEGLHQIGVAMGRELLRAYGIRS